MDRPERSTMTGILGHVGKWSKRWKYSLELNLSKGVSCQQCWNNRLRQIKDFYEGKTKEFNMECSRCANFNYLHPQLHVLPHENYPRTKHECIQDAPCGRDIGLKKLTGVKLSFDHLRQGCKFCFHQLLGGHWNITEARHYLNVLGANKDVENKIVEKFKTAQKHHTKINNRTILTDPELPAYWSNKSISIDHCVDAPMHLLFEGVFKSILELSGE